MKIGIFVMSLTGNTREAAGRLENGMREAGLDVELKTIDLEPSAQPKPDNRPDTTRKLSADLPDETPYDILVFCAPVHAFSLMPQMKEYIGKVGSLAGKRTAFLVTEFFPYDWMGGNQAIRRLQSGCRNKGGVPGPRVIIHWKRKDRERQIDAAVASLTAWAAGPAS